MITIVAGADWTVKYDWDTVDITGYKFFGTLKSDLSLADSAAEMTKDLTVSSGSVAELEFTGAETVLLTAGRYYFDCKIIDTAGNVVHIPTDGPEQVNVVRASTKRTS